MAKKFRVAIKRIQGKINQRSGESAEAIVMHHLSFMGANFLNKIETGWNVRYAGKTPAGKGQRRVVSAYPRKSVQGDISGVISPSGRSILVEVKRRPLKLSCSDFEKHQLEALHRHHEAGGLSLIGWVSVHGTIIMPHVIDGWKKGSPLTWDRAQSFAITELKNPRPT